MLKFSIALVGGFIFFSSFTSKAEIAPEGCFFSSGVKKGTVLSKNLTGSYELYLNKSAYNNGKILYLSIKDRPVILCH